MYYYIGPKGKKNKIMAEACEEVIHIEVPRNQCREERTRQEILSGPAS